MSFLRDMVTRVFGEPVEGMQASVIVDPDDSTRIMHVNSDGSLNIGGTITSSGAVTIAAGADVTEGNTTDAAVVGDNSGTVSAKLRGLTKIFNDVWDSVNHRLHVNVDNANSNGQATMANSAPVTLASDQSKIPTKAASGDFVDGSIATLGLQADAVVTSSASSGTAIAFLKNLATIAGAITSSVMQSNVKQVNGTTVSVNAGNVDAGTQRVVVASDQAAVQVKRSAVAIYSLASTTTSGSTQNSGDLTVGSYTEISLDINTTAQAGTSPTIQYFYERKGADGIYYVLWQSAILTAATNTLSTSIGAGMAYNQSLGSTGRLRWVVGGSATPTFTQTANISGK